MLVHIKSARFHDFRRFHELAIEDLPANTRLVILAGPNGLGKSTIFDGFRVWQSRWSGLNWDADYHIRAGMAANFGAHLVDVDFHETGVSDDQDRAQKAFYYRTAYRIEADFSVSGVVQSMGPIVTNPRFSRMSETDVAVSQNYSRLIESAVAQIFDESVNRTTEQIRRELLEDVAIAMRNIFGDLEVETISDPRSGGAFYFSKGQSRRWHYKNLSGGERAAFDLLLDVVVKRAGYDDTVYCIDEPELHLNTRVQGALLNELLRLLPAECQLIMASHSIGMMKAARERSRDTNDVVFLDFEGIDFDVPQVLRPAVVNRQFWQRTLRVALDDLSDLVAPRTLVLVEGSPLWAPGGKRKSNVAFDARCLEKIFQNAYPDVVFMSVGSSADVEEDKLHLSETTPVLSEGTNVIRVVDRDDRNDDEVRDHLQDGVRVLSRRDLESYLLADGVLGAYLNSKGRPDLHSQAITERDRLLTEHATQGGKPDDIKEISGLFITWLKVQLGISQAGNTKFAFLRDEVAPVVSSAPEYLELERDIFGSGAPS